jgi:DNA-binding transcriptional MocR family regulator
VAAGYDLLRESGHLRSRRGSGSWTSMPERSAGRALSPFAPSGEPGGYDLAFASLAAPEQPMADAVARAAAELGAYTRDKGYQLLGTDVLRDAVADRFTERGLPTTRDQVLVTSGAQQAITVVLAALVAPGERVLVEHPTYANALDAVAHRHARAVPVGFTESDWDLDALAAAVRDTCPRLMYLIADYQNPTGLLMGRERRAEVLALAHRTRTPLLVDETMAELVLDGPAPAPLATLAPSTGSPPLITIGSASKAFWGGLRIGWVRAAPAMLERIARARASMDISTPVFEQLVTAHLLADVEPVLAARRAGLRATRDHLMGLLADRLPGWRYRRPDGGLSLWVDLGAPRSSALVTAAGRLGVQLAAGPRFGLDGAFERHLRLPYTLPEAMLTGALDRLAEAWSTLPEQGAGPVGWVPARAEVA